MSPQRRAFVLAALAGLLSPHVARGQPATRVARVAFLAPGTPTSRGGSV